MRNFTIYLALLLCLFASKINAQEIFEDRVNAIANKIEKITKDEKAALKIEVEAVNEQLINGTITQEEADVRKKKLAEARAITIESKVAAAELELKKLIQEKVDGKIGRKVKVDTVMVNGKATIVTTTTEITDSNYITRKGGKWSIRWKEDNSNPKYRDSIRARRSESRTTSQFVFATGFNNLVTDGAVANSDFRYLGSHFYEWGFTYNTRLAKNNNLLHLKYGLSLMYNNLRATENRMFVDNGLTTSLETSPVHMEDSRFRNVNLVLPLHLEFDFTKKREIDGKPIFRTHESFRFGIGGYAGVNVKSKQIIKTDIDGYKNKEITKGNFNVNDFVYGVSAYVGHEETSIYIKYDLNPLFKNNAVDQNNISLGIRFDLN